MGRERVFVADPMTRRKFCVRLRSRFGEGDDSTLLWVRTGVFGEFLRVVPMLEGNEGCPSGQRGWWVHAFPL